MEPAFDAQGLAQNRGRVWRRLWLLFAVVAVFVSLFIWGNAMIGARLITLPHTTSLKSSPNPVAHLIETPVLMYHYIRVVENPNEDRLGFGLSVTPDNFEAQMAYLASAGYTTITPDDLWQALNAKTVLPAKPVLLTFDDGYQDFYTAAWPILAKYNLKATVFVVTEFVGDAAGRYLTWDQIRQLDSSGLVTIGSHTLHHANVATSLYAQREIFESKRQLEKLLGHPVNWFVYPGGTFNLSAVQLVNQAGYQLAFTTQEGRLHSLENRLFLPRVRISGGMTLERFKQAVAPEKSS